MSEKEASTGEERLTVIEAPETEVKPEDVGMLAIRYVDGVPQITVSGGTAIPEGMAVVDGQGTPVAFYQAGPPPAKPASRNTYPVANIMGDCNTLMSTR